MKNKVFLRIKNYFKKMGSNEKCYSLVMICVLFQVMTMFIVGHYSDQLSDHIINSMLLCHTMLLALFISFYGLIIMIAQEDKAPKILLPTLKAEVSLYFLNNYLMFVYLIIKYTI